MDNDNSTTGEHSSASFCSQYIPLMAIPHEVHEAAQTLHIYFEKQGMREWEFSAVADRRLVTKLERERDEARRWAEEWRDEARAWAEYWGADIASGVTKKMTQLSWEK